MLYYFKTDKNTTEMQKKKDLYNIWRSCCDSFTMSKVVCEICAGDFSLDDAPWSGRLVEVDCNQIETLTENNQCYTMQKRADTLKISKSIKLLVKMKNVSFILWKNQNGLFGQPNSMTCIILCES